MKPRVCLIGLDCAAPELVFDKWRSKLPNLNRLMGSGIWGPLESIIPPITVPAWCCMMTGRDPGSLGIYGFRNRRDRSYEALAFANSQMVRFPALWDLLGSTGRQSIVLGVPLTYPPKPVNGLLVSDFLAPDVSVEFTYPPKLKDEIRDVVGDYAFDVRDFRNVERDSLLSAVYEMTEKRFRLARHFLRTREWDLFAMVEMGVDRMHHAFWRYMDPSHRLHEPNSPYADAILDYYIAVDRHIGDLVSDLPSGTDVFVVSDHGAKRMDGAICLNEWLVREGYLVLKEHPAAPTKFSPAMVDWDRTSAWGDGGYYGRIFLNVHNREPRGCVDPSGVPALLAELSCKLEKITDEFGRPLGSRVFRPNEIYSAAEGVPPDLLVYFGDLHWRSVGSIGHDTIWLRENDTGPDDANHSQHGIAILAKIGHDLGGYRREGMSIYDIAPTALSVFGMEPPDGIKRAPIQSRFVREDGAYSPEEEAALASRLEELGYL